MEKAILAGPFIGEFGWETLRSAPHALWFKKKNPDCKLIVMTREDRFDFYGKNADVLIPLRIEGDGTKYLANCFEMMKYPRSEYDKLVKKFYNKYSKRYQIIKHVYPDLKGRNFLNKNLFPKKQMWHNFQPRSGNVELVKDWINNGKPNLVLAPRFRLGMARNWKHWPVLYDMIDEDKFFRRFNIVLCGKKPDYIPDPKKRFYDINDLELNINTSLIGVTIETLKRSKVCCGSQSGVPNLSNIVRTPTIQWGHQFKLHAKTYNIYDTPTVFINCADKKDFNAVTPEEVFTKLKKFLKP